MASVNNELVTTFKFNGNTEPIQKYNESFSSAVGLMAKGITTAVALAGAMVGFATSTLLSADAMGQLSKEAGISAESLQEWGYIASVNGSSADAFKSSVKGLSSKIGEASLKGSEDFNRLGISVIDANGKVKGTEQVLEEVRGAFKGLSKEQQFSFAEKLGIDKSLINTLNLTSGEINNLKKTAQSLGIISDEDVKKVVEFNDTLTTVKFGFDGLQQKLALGFLPQMQQLASSFTDFMIVNGDLISDGFAKFIDMTGSVITAIFNTGKAIFEAIDYFVGIGNAMVLVTGYIVYFNRALLANPIALVIAAIVGAILVIDDLVVAFEGGNSVIAEFFAGFDIDIVNTLKFAFMGLKNLLNDMLQLTIFPLIEAFLTISKAAGTLGNALGFDIDTKGLDETLKKFQTFRADTQAGNDQRRAEMESLSLSTSGTTQTNNVEIKIATDDPSTAGASVQNAMGTTLDNANRQLGKGGR